MIRIWLKHFANYMLLWVISFFLNEEKMASFLKKLRYISNEKVSYKFPCFYFPLYQMFSFGSVIVDLALPSLPHIK